METRTPPRTRLLRRVLPALVGLALLGASLPGCDWPDGTRFVHPVFSNFDLTSGIVYRSTTTWDGRAIDLRLDIRQPRGDTMTERPVIMWMFGGGWRNGDRNQLRVLAEDSARRGYVGVTIDYRIRPDQIPFDISGAELDAYDDTIAAIQWLKDNAAAYGIDPDVIVPAGISAGAINALHAVYRPGTRGPATTPAAGAVSASGISFVRPPAGRPPVLMTHGTADQTVPFNAASGVCAQANAVGDTCILHPFDGGHTFPPGFSDDAHNFVFERVLLANGYPAPPLPPA
jgi:predicted esterase